MCGICGIWNYRTGEPVDREQLARMSAAIVHRGPDDSDAYYDDANGLGFAFQRLAILDLSSAGNQPMANENNDVWLVFNGEIYNYIPLRKQLEAKGHQFRSTTDTEVLVHQYEERGPASVCDLIGMFAFAIWDRREAKLTLARDPVGKKPLYYFDDGSRLIFGSELKAVVAHAGVPREVDETALGQYLAVGYIPAPNSIFRQIRKLPPGSIMTVTREHRSIEQYWNWQPSFHTSEILSEDEWASRIRMQLETAVRDRLASDVPLGAFLSGGVDSSAVVAMMSRLSDQPVKTFSIGFHNQDYSELTYARQVADIFSTDHHEFIVEPEDLTVLLPRLVQHFDEPFADSSAIPTYYVAKMARQAVVVCLSGDGGDEAFGGYRRYALMMQLKESEIVPLPLRRAIFSIPAALIPSGMFGSRFASRMLLDCDQRYVEAMRFIPERQLRQLLSSTSSRKLATEGALHISKLLESSQQLDYLSRMQYTDGLSYLPGDILVKVDRTSMANSLEVRCPFLDFRVLELAAQTPPEFRLQNGQGKYILKRALEDLLPSEILHRPKMGFGVPLREWFRGNLANYAEEVLLDKTSIERGLWQKKAIQQMLNKHRRGLIAVETPIWVLLVLELWYRTYLD